MCLPLQQPARTFVFTTSPGFGDLDEDFGVTVTFFMMGSSAGARRAVHEDERSNRQGQRACHPDGGHPRHRPRSLGNTNANRPAADRSRGRHSRRLHTRQQPVKMPKKVVRRGGAHLNRCAVARGRRARSPNRSGVQPLRDSDTSEVKRPRRELNPRLRFEGPPS